MEITANEVRGSRQMVSGDLGRGQGPGNLCQSLSQRTSVRNAADVLYGRLFTAFERAAPVMGCRQGFDC